MRIAGTPLDIEGKSVYLTGAAGLLGSHWRNALVDAGAIVYPLDSAWTERPTDVTDPDSVRRAYAWFQETAKVPFGGGLFGPAKTPDALICAAALDAKPGTPGCGPFEDAPLDDWRRIVDVNLTGVMVSCQVIGAEMAKAGHGSIVLVSSMYGLVAPDPRRYEGISDPPFVKPAAYSASKAGLLGLTRYLAAYWGPRNVRVNAVCFGALGQPDHHPAFRERMETAIPLGRLATPEDFTGVLQFLVSDASAYMTGSVLIVDGGATCW